MRTEEQTKVLEQYREACKALVTEYLKKNTDDPYEEECLDCNEGNYGLIYFGDMYIDLQKDAKKGDLMAWWNFNNFCLNHPEFNMKRISYPTWLKAKDRPTMDTVSMLGEYSDRIWHAVHEGRMSVLGVVHNADDKQ